MKKVLVWGMTANWGGIESVLYNYVVHSDKKLVSYDFITTFENIPRENELKRIGCKVIHLPDRRNNFIKYRDSINSFMKYHANEYDVLWFNDCMFGNIDILKLGKKHGIKKRIVHAHNANSLGGGLSRLIRHKLNSMLLPLYVTDYWACSHLAGKWTYSERIRKKDSYKVVNNAIDCDSYKFHETKRIRTREKLGIDENVFVVGHIGRFDYQKNHKYLLHIFREIVNTNKYTILLLIGTGSDFEDIKKLSTELGIGKNVFFLGQRTDIPQLLQAMDVFVLPSQFEGLPVVLVEAMASGLKCFISDKVTQEASIIPELCIFKSIDSNPKEWADEIINDNYYYDRRQATERLKQAGFDIETEALKISKEFMLCGIGKEKRNCF